MASIPSIKLNDGSSIPVIGYGLGTANYKAADAAPFEPKIVKGTVTATKVGYYHLDGAEGMAHSPLFWFRLI
jgi:diketogulonate reductase-like aldo/keto reductase